MSSQSQTREEVVTFVVIGGGIAGVTCAETLSLLSPKDRIILLTASPLIKAVTNFKQVSKTLESFDVTERFADSLQSQCSNVSVIKAVVVSLDTDQHILSTDSGQSVRYNKLCICTGGKPKLICDDNPHVLGIRDTDSVQTFQKKLSNAKRVIVVGNGGIATELVYELEGCEVVWVIKDDCISTLYLDPGAAQFLIPRLTQEKHPNTGPLKRHKYTVTGEGESSPVKVSTPGGALGPDWAEKVTLTGGKQSAGPKVHIEYNTQVKHVWTSEEFKQIQTDTSSECSNKELGDWPVYIELSNGVKYGCDLVVSATGVKPNTDNLLAGNQFELDEDGGLKVCCEMKTSVQDVFAAGDVCTVKGNASNLWQQMRLWSQARQMGAYAAKCMVADVQGEPIQLDFCFELFAHVTKFFNYKVILLGKYNGHDLGKDYSVLVRVSEGVEYVKTVMYGGRMVGATLIGETDLEETFENLILNQLDLSSFGEDLLHPGVDIEDFFD